MNAEFIKTRNIAYSLILLVAASSGAESYDNINLLDPIPLPDTSKPVAAAATASRLYILDEAKGQLRFYDLDGKFIKATGGLDSPRGLAVGMDGKVFVTDTGRSRVQIFDADGTAVGFFGTRGSAPGQLKNPESVAVGQDGRVYVADTGNGRVQVFTEEGILLFSIGEAGKLPGQLKSPKKIVVDPSDTVYVLDPGNDRIQKFDANAKAIKELPAMGDDFTVDAYGYVYQFEGSGGKVVELDPRGNVLGKFGNSGSGPGQSKKAEGLAVAADGSIIVVDTGNKRLMRVELPNKDKTVMLPPNLETKILVSGPSRVFDAAAEAIAVLNGEVYGWLTKDKQFAVFDAQGKERKRIGAKDAKGKGPSVTQGAAGFALSAKHGMFVADGPSNRLQHFTPEGAWKQNIAESAGVFDSKKKEGRVKDPRGVTINEKGTVYVADTGNRRVDAFNTQGVFLTALGPTIGQLELQQPTAVAWDRAQFLYILDAGLKKIVKTEPSGAFRAAWGEPGSGPGQLQDPVSMAYDGHAYLYVLDAGNRRVSVFSKDGRWETDLFAGGKGERSLTEPVAIAIDGPRLYIADKGRGKILAFDLHFKLSAPVGLALSAKEGVVSATWKPLDNTWLNGYEVFRATEAGGKFASLGKVEKTLFEDIGAEADARYWYRVSALSKSDDAGVPSTAVEFHAPAAFNRSPVELSTIAIGNIFSANYKWYLKNPAGYAVVTNNVRAQFENVKLTFRLKDFMDFGYDTEIKKLGPRQTVQIPLIATLNNKILEVSEDTPIQAEFTLTYFEKGEQKSVSMTKPLRVYSRNAITWDDPRRIATFITPKDPPVLEFARAAGKERPKTAKARALNDNVLTAMTLWDALSEHGLSFFTNPSNPYETVSEDPNFPVDYTQFPRETLKRRSGQCDDLTTLLISMLDASKVKSAVLDYPGHMALMIDTEASDVAGAGLPEEKLVKRHGTYWVPIEATMIGKPFANAVAKAAQAYKAEEAKGKVTIIDVAESWKQYEPATMPAVDWTPEPPKGPALSKRLETEAADLFEARYSALQEHYAARLKADASDVDAQVDLGILEHEAGHDEKAAAWFEKAAAADPNNAAALTNLGNTAYLKGDFEAAQKRYLQSVNADAEDPDLWMNLARAEAKLKNKVKAHEYGKKAVGLDARLSPLVEALTKGL